MACSLFKKADRAVEEALKKKELEEKEWIWVEGYKGTDKDLKCRDYQFEIGKQFDMPEGKEIIECSSGFHLCLNLGHVFDHYKIGEGNRFFRVRALVRRKDFEEYDKEDTNKDIEAPRLRWSHGKTKLTSKSIHFLYELTPDQIFAGTEAEDWSLEDKLTCLNDGAAEVKRVRHVRDLVELGYSEAFAIYIVHKTDKYEVAKAIGAQKDLSMDMKVLAIMSGELAMSAFTVTLNNLQKAACNVQYGIYSGLTSRNDAIASAAASAFSVSLKDLEKSMYAALAPAPPKSLFQLDRED